MKLISRSGGSASPHLNVGDIKQFPVPLPPLPEQTEIVRRVESLFALADKLMVLAPAPTLAGAGAPVSPGRIFT